MKVNLTLDVDDFERYVIAQYYGEKKNNGKSRRRALRSSIKRFIRAALRTSALDRADDLPRRKRKAAYRIRLRLTQQPNAPEPEQLSQRERQREMWLEGE
jgi:hypothetical protein